MRSRAENAPSVRAQSSFPASAGTTTCPHVSATATCAKRQSQYVPGGTRPGCPHATLRGPSCTPRRTPGCAAAPRSAPTCSEPPRPVAGFVGAHDWSADRATTARARRADHIPARPCAAAPPHAHPRPPGRAPVALLPPPPLARAPAGSSAASRPSRASSHRAERSGNGRVAHSGRPAMGAPSPLTPGPWCTRSTSWSSTGFAAV